MTHKTSRTIHLCLIEQLEVIKHLLIGGSNKSTAFDSQDIRYQTGANTWLIYFTGQHENKVLSVSSFFKFIPLRLDSNVYAFYEDYKGLCMKILYCYQSFMKINANTDHWGN